MTDIRFGKQYDDSTATYDITSLKDSKGNVSVGDQHDRSKRTVVLREQGGMEDQSDMESKNARLNLVLAFIFGVLFMSVILTLIVHIPNPTKAQAHVFSVVLALAAGGFASALSGMLNVRLTLGSRVAIGATGALAVFVIVYFFMPAF
jgi:VIT1/CCC1 family predicted Fe2+/Mn2+ transporter